MSHTRLLYLCEGFCRITHASVPELREGEDGVVAFNLAWRDVLVDVMVRPAASDDHAFILFDLGPPDTARVPASRTLLALMQMNFLALRVNQPVFSCHPQTQAVVLQWAFPLTDSTAAGLHQAIEEGVQLALQWRETFFLPDGDSQATSQPSPNATGSYA